MNTSYDFWIVLWKAVFIVAVLVFAGMSMWVAIGGWRDVKDLFRRLDEERSSDERES